MNNQTNIEQIIGEYERYGVTRVREFLSAAQIEEINVALQRYERDVLPKLQEGDRTFEADGKTVRNLWRMERQDEYFLTLTERPEIRNLIAKLMHGEPLLVGVETFNKPARVGSAVPWHQDNAYFCQSPPDMLTVWIAIDPATVKNGAVYYAPGSQHELLPHVPSGVVGNSMGVTNQPTVSLEEQFCGELDPGDALIHHCQVLHRSEPNKSEYSRLGLLMVFRGTHTQDDPSLKSEYEKACNNA